MQSLLVRIYYFFYCIKQQTVPSEAQVRATANIIASSVDCHSLLILEDCGLSFNILHYHELLKVTFVYTGPTGVDVALVGPALVGPCGSEAVVVTQGKLVMLGQRAEGLCQAGLVDRHDLP